MNGITAKLNILEDQETQIVNFLKTHIDPAVTDWADRYLAPFKARLDNVFNEWLNLLKKQSTVEGCFKVKIQSSVYLDRETFNFIMDIFNKKADIRYNNVDRQSNDRGFYITGENSLINVLPKGYQFSFDCLWNPTNKFIYSETMGSTANTNNNNNNNN